MTGTITRVENQTAIVVVTVTTADGTRTVPMEQWEWHHLLEVRGSVEGIVGQAVKVMGAGAAASIRFLDEPDLGGR